MIVLVPHGGFLSEVSRAIEIGRALVARGEQVLFASHGGSYAHLVADAGFELRPLDPPADPATFARFVRALSVMDGNEPLFDEGELERAVEAEVELFREVGARLVVTGFTLTTYLSTRLVGIPLVTDHGGSFVPPVLAHRLCPVPVNPPDPNLARLPRVLQRHLVNRVPALIGKAVAPLNHHADALGVERIPGLLGLMCGDLTLVTETPDVLGLSDEQLARWRPRWPFKVRTNTTFRLTGPLFARLDLPIPPEVDEFLDGDEPVVYLAPTSVEESYLRDLVAAVRWSGAKLLVGGTVHRLDDLADERTVVAGVLPNHLVMPRVAAAVIMGGQGSVQTAIASSTPFVGLPMHGEQELNVAVAERLGVAIRMSPHVATTEALGAAVRRLLDEPTFRTNAQRAAQRYDGVDGAANAADAIVAYARSRPAERGRPMAVRAARERPPLG